MARASVRRPRGSKATASSTDRAQIASTPGCPREVAPRVFFCASPGSASCRTRRVMPRVPVRSGPLLPHPGQAPVGCRIGAASPIAESLCRIAARDRGERYQAARTKPQACLCRKPGNIETASPFFPRLTAKARLAGRLSLAPLAARRRRERILARGRLRRTNIRPRDDAGLDLALVTAAVRAGKMLRCT